jgi:TPR repeat protein
MTGRPRGPGRRWSVALWATPSERAEVERRAAEAGLPVARYLLAQALEEGRSPTSPASPRPDPPVP